MKITETSLSGVLLLEPRSFADARGFFYESFQVARYAQAGIAAPFIQDNVSRSICGTLRGLHYQLKQPQGKLVSVIRGAIFDVAIDIRKTSPTFAKWYGTILSDENHAQLWVPPGFAHGFLVLSDVADVTYKVTAPYDGTDDRGIRWNDPTIAIQWPEVPGAPLLSPKDAAAPMLAGNDFLP